MTEIKAITNTTITETSAMESPSNITRTLLNEDQRLSVTAKLFGINFPMQLEPFIYAITRQLSSEYKGGYWELYSLTNGGFYMAPCPDKQFHLVCENGYEGDLSADAMGIVATMYAYSNLSFGGANAFTETCAEQYHLLREFMFEHAEVSAILAAID